MVRQNLKLARTAPRTQNYLYARVKVRLHDAIVGPIQL
jgi:hypothetical protein